MKGPRNFRERLLEVTTISSATLGVQLNKPTFSILNSLVTTFPVFHLVHI